MEHHHHHLLAWVRRCPQVQRYLQPQAKELEQEEHAYLSYQEREKKLEEVRRYMEHLDERVQRKEEAYNDVVVGYS